MRFQDVRPHWRPAVCLAALLMVLPCYTAQGVDVVLDYTYAGAFFSTSTTRGQQARAAVEAAADYFSEILVDTFDPIEAPPTYSGDLSTYTLYWDANFTDPTTGLNQSVRNPMIAANQYRIYVGGRILGGSTLGTGGPGGWSTGSNTNGPGFYPDEINDINALNNNLVDALRTRGEASGYAGWGGVLTFDADANWHYDHTTSVPSGMNDLYSVAIHELGHALGLGTVSEWSDLISGSSFLGSQATSVYGGNPPVTSGHWAEGTQSTIYGTNTPQEASLDPTITVGTRKEFTSLDAAGLRDIGWSTVAPQPPVLVGDYNGDDIVDAADYTVWRDTLGQTGSGLAADGSGNNWVDQADYDLWRDNYGNASSTSASSSVPEPAALLLVAFGASLLVCRRSALR